MGRAGGCGGGDGLLALHLDVGDGVPLVMFFVVFWFARLSIILVAIRALAILTKRYVRGAPPLRRDLRKTEGGLVKREPLIELELVKFHEIIINELKYRLNFFS